MTPKKALLKFEVFHVFEQVTIRIPVLRHRLEQLLRPKLLHERLKAKTTTVDFFQKCVTMMLSEIIFSFYMF